MTGEEFKSASCNATVGQRTDPLRADLYPASSMVSFSCCIRPDAKRPKPRRADQMKRHSMRPSTQSSPDLTRMKARPSKRFCGSTDGALNRADLAATNLVVV